MVHDSLRNLTGGSDTGPGVGDSAPAFELRRTFEETVASSELLTTGPVLLVFYVFDFGHV
jgi:peroxiredoxin